MSAVNANMFAAAGGDISLARRRPALMALPLNLVAMIVMHLDDVADLARLCRTCRVLNYMALPQLYRHLTLTSYDKIRYRDHRAEGCGSASPFSMGLNAVVTRNVGNLVHSLTLRGAWREDELEEHARVGRVPDSSMMLNIVVRAAVDKMVQLEEVSWQLNTKMLEPVYQGLAQLPKLTSLTVKFPSSRHPRPITVIPGMPHLRALKITDIDPLCYPDDISTLLFKSKKLRDLKLHWSPRMREAQEASVSLNDYFRRCIAAKSPLSLKKVAFQNLYAFHREEFTQACDHSTLEEITVLHGPGVTDEATMTFVDSSWPMPTFTLGVKSLRYDRLDKRSCEFLGTLQQLEKLYLVNPIRDAGDYINSPRNLSAQSSATLTPPSGDGLVPFGQNGTASDHDGPDDYRAHIINFQPQSPQPINPSQPYLRDMYLHTITSTHGAKLRHLILPSRWPLPAHLIARLVRACPQLEQLAIAPDMSSMETFSLLLPFLRKLRALRLLIPTPYTGSGPISRNGAPQNGQSGHRSCPDISPRVIAEVVDLDDRIHNEAMGMKLADMEIFGTLKVLGLGWKAWELGELYTIPASAAAETFRWLTDIASTIHTAPAADHYPPSPPTADAASHFLNPEPCSRVFGHQQPKVWSVPPSSLGKRKHPFDSSDVNDNNNANNTSPSPSPPENSTTPTNTHRPNPPKASSRKSSTSASPSASTSATTPPIIDPSTVQPKPQQSHQQPPFPNPPFTYNSTGEPISYGAMIEIARCMPPPAAKPPPSDEGGASGGGGEEEVLYRRRVKRVGWEVLKNWEIWGLDSQEI
ncbi:hypothetical protein FQN50_009890 [Emmonsiellopsis sp. PD_5]|nr:hypothetical protein FQN50_009890 [Emmonsiellopsis sp. PD_5]